jgi:hypothetical protein
VRQVEGILTQPRVSRYGMTVAVLAVMVSLIPTVYAQARLPSSPRALARCGNVKGPFGEYKNVRVRGMSCKQAKKLIKQGGPVQAHYKCTFRYGKTTFTPSCTKGKRYITYTGKLAGGKA